MPNHEETPTPAPAPASPETARSVLAPAVAYAKKLGPWLVLLGAMALVNWLTSRGVQVPPVPLPPIAEGEVPPVAQTLPPGPPADVLYYCGRVETLADQLNTRPWPVKDIPWSVDTSGYSGVLTRAQIVEAFDVAWRAWSKDIDISPRFVESPEGALVQCHFASIDGPSRVLAWSELADGTKTPKTQRYDSAERWTIAQSPSQAQIDLVRVACHEIGHVLGLVHDDVGTGSLMEPTYSTVVRFPTPRDTQRMIALGYKRRTTGGTPAPQIIIEAAVDPEKMAELLRRHGYDVKLIGR